MYHCEGEIPESVKESLIEESVPKDSEASTASTGSSSAKRKQEQLTTFYIPESENLNENHISELSRLQVIAFVDNNLAFNLCN